jgi:Protein of unknown function (DUF3667)
MGAITTSSYEYTVCKNCGNNFHGSFCNTCGQKASVTRITWNSIMHYLLHAFFHLDDGFFYTIKQMAVRPGHTIREYLEGKRQAHYNPFLMLLLLAGICSILFVHFHFQTILAEVSLDKVEAKNSFVAHKFFFARTIFFCLLCSIGDFLFFRNRQYSLAEMVVANVFMFSEITVFQLLFVPVLLIGRYLDINMYLRFGFIVLVMVYLFYCHFQFYNARGKPWLITKIIIALLCYLAAVVVIGNTIVRPFFN